MLIAPDHLLQHADPSAGWAQHAPAFSSGLLLGVQQTSASSLGVQQEFEDVDTFFLLTWLFASTGITVCVSINNDFVFTFIDGDDSKRCIKERTIFLQQEPNRYSQGTACMGRHNPFCLGRQEHFHVYPFLYGSNCIKAA